jgi:hypothetical protein
MMISRRDNVFVLTACGAVGLGLSLAGLCDAQQVGEAPTPVATTPTLVVAPDQQETIAEWVRQLDDDRFAVREEAHSKLVGQGYAALPAVGEAAASGSLERTTRAVSILLQWAQSEDSALSLGSLEQLAGLTNRPAESAMASQRLADVREAAALKQIVSLGGRLPFDPNLAGPAYAGMPLQIIIGPEWKGGVDGLAHIETVPRATTLSFHSAPDAIDEHAIAELTKLTQLQRLEFYGTAISPEGVEKLRDQLTHTVIDVRRGARLGIAGVPGMAGGGAIVQGVQSGSAAEKAKLMPGDVITEIGGVAVLDFDSLTKEIAKAQPGESAVLKVMRPATPGGQPIETTITVEFDKWGDEPAPNPATAPTEANPFGPVQIQGPGRVIINRR